MIQKVDDLCRDMFGRNIITNDRTCAVLGSSDYAEVVGLRRTVGGAGGPLGTDMQWNCCCERALYARVGDVPTLAILDWWCRMRP